MSGVGVFLDDRPRSTGPTQAPEAPAVPASLGDVLGAHWRLGRQDQAGAERQAEFDAYGPIVEAMSERAPKNWLGLPDAGKYVMFSRQDFQISDALWEDIAAERARDPSFLKDLPATSDAEFKAWVKGEETRKRRAAQEVVSRQRGAQHLAGFAADVGTGLLDPVNLGVMALTGGAGATTSIWRGMAREALINGTTELVETPIIASNRAAFGEDYTAADAALGVAVAGVGGAGFHAATRGAARAAKAAANSPAARAAGRALAPLALDRARLDVASDGEVAQAFASARAAEYRTPDEAAALHVLGRAEEIARASPFVPNQAGLAAHEDRLQEALAALLATGTRKPSLNAGTAIASGVVPTFAPSTAPAARTPDLSADRVIRFVINDLEGGAAVVRYSDADGGTTKWGIAAKHNPGVDIANLSEAEAAAIAKRKYWFDGLDQADPRTAAIAFDAGYISGPKVGKRILAESGGDPAQALALYRAHLDAVATRPGKGRYRKGWQRRIDKLEAMIGGTDGGARVILDPAGFRGDADGLAIAQRGLDDADFDARMLAQEQAIAARSREAGDPVDDPEGFAIEGSAFDYVPEPGRAATSEPSPQPVPAPEVAPARAMAMDGLRVPSITPKARELVEAYVGGRGSLDPARAAKVLGLPELEVQRALASLASVPNGRVVVARNGRFQRRPVRRAPVDLNRFLSDLGGIADSEGHDLATGRGLQKFVPGSGMLFRKGGMSLDRAREAPAEAGYFVDFDPDTAHGETTVADFLDLLEAAQSTPAYARGDLMEAMDRAAERELAEELRLVQGAIDARLADHGFAFDRLQLRRAAEAIRQDGLTEDEAILRVVNEDMRDALDELAIEAEGTRYDVLAEEFERTLADPDGGDARSAGGPVDHAGDAGEGGAGAAQRGGAEQDARDEAGLEGPPPLDGGALRDFDDPDGSAARAVADSLEHDLRATVPEDAVSDINLSQIMGVQDHGAPGIQVYDAFGDGALINATFRDSNGVAKANVGWWTDPAMQKEYGVVVYVDPAFRRQGIANQLYDALAAAGHDIDRISGTTDLTPAGAAFVTARRRAKAATRIGNALDRGEATDPAIAARQRQEAQLEAASPMRAGTDQEDTIGLGLFDAADQYRLDVEGDERGLDDILWDFEADEAAIKAAKDCQ